MTLNDFNTYFSKYSYFLTLAGIKNDVLISVYSK